MTTLVDEWRDFVLRIARTPPLHLSGPMSVYPNVTWKLDPKVFFDKSLTLESIGYTQTKLKQLTRYYYNPDDLKRARAEIAVRVERNKYGSCNFNFRGKPKVNTAQDYCLSNCIISYFPRYGTTIQVTWRTAEVVKRFRGDLVFLRDFILPHFGGLFHHAPVRQITFHFANVSLHLITFLLMMPYLDNWRSLFARMKRESPEVHRTIIYWAWWFMIDPSVGINRYSVARQARNIMIRTTPLARAREIAQYVDTEIQHNLKDYPERLQKHYRRKSCVSSAGSPRRSKKSNAILPKWGAEFIRKRCRTKTSRTTRNSRRSH